MQVLPLLDRLSSRCSPCIGDVRGPLMMESVQGRLAKHWPALASLCLVLLMMFGRLQQLVASLGAFLSVWSRSGAESQPFGALKKRAECETSALPYEVANFRWEFCYCLEVIGFAVMRVIGALFLNETHLGPRRFPLLKALPFVGALSVLPCCGSLSSTLQVPVQAGHSAKGQSESLVLRFFFRLLTED